jgi:hypothetical protein
MERRSKGTHPWRRGVLDNGKVSSLRILWRTGHVRFLHHFVALPSYTRSTPKFGDMYPAKPAIRATCSDHESIPLIKTIAALPFTALLRSVQQGRNRVTHCQRRASRQDVIYNLPSHLSLLPCARQLRLAGLGHWQSQQGGAVLI